MLSHRGSQLCTQAQFKWMDCKYPIGIVLRYRLRELRMVLYTTTADTRPTEITTSVRLFFSPFQFSGTLILETLDISKHFWTLKHFGNFVKR